MIYDLSEMWMDDQGRFPQRMIALTRQALRPGSANGHVSKSSAPPEESLAVRDLSEVDPEPVNWLVPNLLPLGKVTLLAGEGGQGKSTLLLDMAARLSMGLPCCGLDPESACEPCDTLLIGCEDDTADTILPRLISAGADLERCHEVLAVCYTDSEGKERRRPFSFEDIGILSAALQKLPDVRLVIIDPVTAFVGRSKTDDHKDSELRALLSPLAEMAAARNVAVVLVAHLNKSTTSKASHRVLGGVGYVNMSRSTWLVTPDQDTPGRYLMMPSKQNLPTADRRGFSYTLDGLGIEEARGLLTRFGKLQEDDRERLAQQLYRVTWHERVSGDVNAMFASGNRNGDSSKIAECADWLKSYLQTYAYPDDELEVAATSAGFSRSTYKHAKIQLRRDGEMRSKPIGEGGAWWHGLGSPTTWTFRPEGDQSVQSVQSV